jgi:hypothetical protein
MNLRGRERHSSYADIGLPAEKIIAEPDSESEDEDEETMVSVSIPVPPPVLITRYLTQSLTQSHNHALTHTHAFSAQRSKRM